MATQPSKQSRAHRRREQQLRATLCRQAAIKRGYRHAAPLIDVLADYGAISNDLPWPSQITMAHDAGVTDRTIRNWLTILEALDIITVYRSTPRRQPNGEWNRRTNRYLLCDLRASRQAPTSPLRRRHTKPATNPATTPQNTPTGNAFPLTQLGIEPSGGASPSAPPPRSVEVQACGNPEPESVQNKPQEQPDLAIEQVRALLNKARTALKSS